MLAYRRYIDDGITRILRNRDYGCLSINELLRLFGNMGQGHVCVRLSQLCQ
jgi:hypothetical protein